MIRALSALILIAMIAADAEGQGQDAYAAARKAMVDDIVALTRETRLETGRATLSPRVLAAVSRVPRHQFVPPDMARSAYDNRPLPIGLGQTISQPFIVALMTDLLDLKPEQKVLEVGTGSGYQAAVLGELAREVYTVEIVEPLAREAKARLEALGYKNVFARSGDGYQGWREHAPFDAIMVTAGAREVPQPLVQQLKPGGRLVIPVGPQLTGQQLLVIDKDAAGRTTTRNVLAVRFVPLTGGSR